MSHETKDLEQEILAMLLKRLARFSTRATGLHPQADLTSDLNLDSVNMMELLMEIEDHFDVSIPLNTMADVSTIQDLAERIRKIVENAS